MVAVYHGIKVIDGYPTPTHFPIRDNLEKSLNQN